MLEGYGDILTIEELAEVLMVGRNYAYGLCRDGSINAFQVGTKWRIPKISVENYIYSKSKLKNPFINLPQHNREFYM